MLFNYGFKSVSLLFFFINGLIFALLLTNKGLRNKNASSNWLGTFIALSSLYITPFMLGYAGWYGKQPYRDLLFYIPFQQLLLLPPVLYLYVLTLLDQSFRFKRTDLLHFLPAALYLTYIAIIFISDKVFHGQPQHYADGRDKDFDLWYQLAGFASLSIYSLLSLRAYKRYEQISYQLVSFADNIMFSWVRRFLFALLGLLALRTLFFVLNPEWAAFGKKYWYYVSFATLCHYIAVNGYTNYLQSIIPFSLKNDLKGNNEVPEGKSRPNDSPLPVDIQELEQLQARIEQLMTVEGLYKDPELTLAQLSERLNASLKKTSHAINQCSGMNFNDLINNYRAREVIRLMNSGAPDLLTLLGIALDCGFNSKSTFNRAFKKHTGSTPREYLARIRKINGAKS